MIENHGEELSPELLDRCVELAADVSEQQFRNRSFGKLTPAVLANFAMMNLSQNQTGGFAMSSNQAGTTVQTWALNFVSPSLQNLLLSACRWRDMSLVLQKRIDQAEAKCKPLARLHLAMSHSQKLQPQVDEKRIVDALSEIGREPECALIAAAGLMSRRNNAEARLVAESFSTSDVQDALTRELIILFSSAALNENARVEESLKALANHKIDNMTAQWILYVLQRSSANELARNSTLLTKIVQSTTPKRSQPRTVASSQLPSRTKQALTAQETRVQEMVQLSNDGKQKEAVKIAKQIVSKPRVFPSPVVSVAVQNASRLQRMQRPSTTQAGTGRMLGYEGTRKAAFGILKKHLELGNLIAETKQSLDANPHSFTLLDQLAEMYEHEEANGTMPNAERTLDEAMRVRPNASLLRLHYAKLLSSSGKYSEASDQYLELIRRDASLGLTTVSESQNVFQMCGRSEELLKAIREANFYSVQDRDTLLGVGNLIVNSGKGFEVGATIVEKLIEIDDTLAPIAVMNAYYPNQVLYPRLFRFTRDALIPNENDVAGNPWFGLDSIMAQRVSESFFFRRILLCHREDDIVSELRGSIQAASDRFPSWLGGQVMLAMIAERISQPDECKRILTELSRNKRLFEQCPENVAYELAKLLVGQPETRMTAIKLLEPICNSLQFVSYGAHERPTLILAKAWLAEGQRGKAIESLLKDRVGILNPGPLGRVDSSQIPLQMLELGLPIDAYRHLDVAKRETTRTSNVERSVTETAVDAVKLKAIDMLEKMSAPDAVKEILPTVQSQLGNCPPWS